MALTGAPLRQTAENMGFKVDWFGSDPANRYITLTNPYGTQSILREGAGGFNIDSATNRAYIDPYAMSSVFMNPANFKPAEITPADISSNLEMAKTLYSPMLDYYNQALDKQLSALNRQTSGQKGLVDAGYSQGLSNLQRQEEGSRMAASHSVAGRNISNSPLAEYERSKVTKAYAPEYQQLESNKAANIANIAANAIAAAENLTATGMANMAPFIGKIGDAAYNMALEKANAPLNFAQRGLNFLSTLGNVQRDDQQTQFSQDLSRDQFNWEKDVYEREWPYKKATYEYNLSRPYSSGGSGGSGLTFKDALSDVTNLFKNFSANYGSQEYADRYSTEYGMLSPAQAVEQEIFNQRDSFIENNIDTKRLIDAVYKLEYGMGYDDYWKQANSDLTQREAEAQAAQESSAPWWQFWK